MLCMLASIDGERTRNSIYFFNFTIFCWVFSSYYSKWSLDNYITIQIILGLQIYGNIFILLHNALPWMTFPQSHVRISTEHFWIALSATIRIYDTRNIGSNIWRNINLSELRVFRHSFIHDIPCKRATYTCRIWKYSLNLCKQCLAKEWRWNVEF